MKVLLVLLFAITLSVCHGFVRDIVRGLTTCSDSHLSKSPVADIEQSCLDDADRGMCRFYQCLERRYPCDACRFAKEYGQRVCEKFELPTIYNRFDDAGKRWVNATNRCLLSKLKELYQRSSVSCDETKATMLEQVSNCFLRNEAGVSLCDIAAANREALKGVFRAGISIISRSVRSTLLELRKSCLMSGTNVAGRRGEFLAKRTNLRNRIRERIMNGTQLRQ